MNCGMIQKRTWIFTGGHRDKLPRNMQIWGVIVKQVAGAGMVLGQFVQNTIEINCRGGKNPNLKHQMEE